MIVNMVSGPRNISTAMMYSFGQRDRCIPIDEPFYGYYLSTSGVTHPSSSHIVSSMPLRTELIIQNIKGLDSEDSLVFVKNMGHHLRNMDWEFMMPFTNFFLIREPKKVIHSFAKVIPNPSIDDIETHRPVFRKKLHDDRHPALLCKLDRIAYQVQQNLPK